MADGAEKNWDVVKAELREFGRDQLHNIKRLAKPSLNPKNREHFVPHVLTAFISTFYGMRRVLTYTTVIALLVIIGEAVAGLF